MMEVPLKILPVQASEIANIEGIDRPIRCSGESKLLAIGGAQFASFAGRQNVNGTGSQTSDDCLFGSVLVHVETD